MKSPPAGTDVLWTNGENMSQQKHMKGPPAATEALPVSRIELVVVLPLFLCVHLLAFTQREEQSCVVPT